MASTLTSPQAGFSIQGTLTDASRSGATVVATVNDATSQAYAVGTNAGQVAIQYSANLTVGTNATTLDLTSLNDPDGNAIAFTKLMGAKLTNLSTNTSNVTMGGGTTPIYGAFPVNAQGGTNGNSWCGFVANNGLTVTGGATNNLKLISDTASTPVSLTLFGR